MHFQNYDTRIMMLRVTEILKFSGASDDFDPHKSPYVKQKHQRLTNNECHCQPSPKECQPLGISPKKCQT